MKFNFSEMTDSELVSFGVMFFNGATYGDPEDDKIYEAMTDEVAKRGEDVKKDFAYMQDVL